MRFTHPGQAAPLFDGLDLHIGDGERVGLVGRSGGGKTSIIRLLLRLMDVDPGRILVGGRDITRLTQADLRSLIAYVPQDPVMFHRTLGENIAFGRPGATEAQVRAAAAAAHVLEFADALPQGFDTLVGERGVKLSGGQRQRVAIARAVLRDAPVLLLDEATSALDSESEAHIQDALWRMMEGRTAIVVAHRLSTVAGMDRLVVLDRGRVVEEGSHVELLARGGRLRPAVAAAVGRVPRRLTRGARRVRKATFGTPCVLKVAFRTSAPPAARRLSSFGSGRRRRRSGCRSRAAEAAGAVAGEVDDEAATRSRPRRPTAGSARRRG